LPTETAILSKMSSRLFSLILTSREGKIHATMTKAHAQAHSETLLALIKTKTAYFMHEHN